MKKLTVLALAGLVLVSAALFFPLTTVAAAATSTHEHSMDECYSDYERCRENALDLDAPWWKVMVILTVCDVALGKCALHL